MYLKELALKTDADFYNAILFGLIIAVHQENELIEYGVLSHGLLYLPFQFVLYPD
jgi:hypothetical protein